MDKRQSQVIPHLLYSSNLGDRTFYAYKRMLWERRWTGSTWKWLAHPLAPITNASSIGVLLGDTDKDVAALYIRQEPGFYPVGYNGKFLLSERESTWATWQIYRFRLSTPDPSVASLTEVSPYPLLETVSLPTVSSLQVSSQWKLYAHIAVDNFEDGPTSDPFTVSHMGGIGIARFDVDLKPETWRGLGRTHYDQGQVAGRVSVMSDSDVFALPRVATNQKDVLFHVDVPFDRAQHKGKTLNEISDGKDSGVARLFGTRHNGKLFERVYDNGWDWRKHGRPVAKKDFVRVIPGSMRQQNDRLFYAAEVTWGTRVYERWTDGSGGWWWADHGHPSTTGVTEIGHPLKDSFFVTTDDGHLWLRHWRHGDGRWAWHDHGTPP